MGYSSEHKELLGCNVLGRTVFKMAESRKLACCDWVRVSDIRWERRLQKLSGLYAKTISISSINDALRRRARTISNTLESKAWRPWSPTRLQLTQCSNGGQSYLMC